MAMRKEWAGEIMLDANAPLVRIAVEAVKATTKYAGKEPIKDLCACHTLPLDRSHRCANTMQPPAGKVKGAERPDGSYAVIGEAEIAAIAAQVESEVFEPLGLESASECPLESASELYWLRAPSKVKSQTATDSVAALYNWLHTRERALLGRVTIRQRQYVVAVHSKGGKLCMSRLRYAQEMQTPDVEIIAPANAPATDPAMLELMDNLTANLPRSFDIAQAEDASVTLKSAAIAAALGGKAPEGVPAPEPAVETPDLMAALKAEMAGKKPARPATAKDKVKA